jgi:protein O-GlcNAc transferase
VAKARAKHGNAVAAELDRAERLIETGRSAEALGILSETLAAHPRKTGEIGEIMARAAIVANDASGATALLESAGQLASPKLRWRIRCTTAEGLRLSGRHDEAAKIFGQVIDAGSACDARTVARASIGLANILCLRHEHAEAEALLRRALVLDPNSAPGAVRLTEVLVMRSNHDAAIEAASRALALDLGPGGLWGRLTAVLYVLGKKSEARKAASIALQVDANDQRALFVSGKLHTDARLPGIALTFFERRLAVTPDDVPTLTNVAHCYGELGRPAEAAQALTRALSLEPNAGICVSNLLYTRHHDPAISPEAAAEETVRLATTGYAAPASWTSPRHPRRHDAARLKIGYVSADFREHAVSHFLEAILREHDHETVETVLYSANETNDAVTARLAAIGDHWREITKLSDDDAARLVARDEVDILVDLSGHTAGGRLGIFARKPAPIQATWLGYFGTTGLREIDYIIADPTVLPDGEEHLYAERPIRLDPCYLAFTVPPDDVEVAPPPCGENRAITFGCHNRLSKYNDGVASLWTEVLDAVPGSILSLRARQFDDPVARARAIEIFAPHGISADRLVLRPPAPRRGILAAYSEMDIALDPFPFAGGTTTSEALWMGVPVVTLKGTRFAGRVSESILRTVGLGELVAEHRDAYVRIAAALAADRGRLAELRRTMRERMLASPFMDAAGFARKLEGAYRRMWLDRIGETTERNAA